MKLSTRLLWLLAVVFIALFCWQIIVSKRGISDMKLIYATPNKELHAAMKHMNTYELITSNSFSVIKINSRLYTKIIKSDSYEVYMSNYNKNDIKIEIVNDTLTMSLKETIAGGYNWDTPIMIFMPEENQHILFTSYGHGSCDLMGFDGENMQIKGDKCDAYLTTDMKNINLLATDNSDIGIYIDRLENYRKHQNDTISVHAEIENSTFQLSETGSRTEEFNYKIAALVNVDLKLREGSFDVRMNDNTPVGTLKIRGSVRANIPEEETDNKDADYQTEVPYYHYYNSTLLTSNSCDSLLLNLTCDKRSYHNLQISEELKGVHYESIKYTPNVLVRKVKKTYSEYEDVVVVVEEEEEGELVNPPAEVEVY